MGDVKDRLGFVEQNLQTLEDHVLEELELLKKAMRSQDELCTRFMELFANLQEQLDIVKVGVEETRQETAMCKRAIAGGAVVTPSPRVDAPKPKELSGKQDAKELDNFIWHMERDFEGASITDEKAKVRTAILYLTNTVTLWWRRKHNNIEKGLCTIDTWDVFKKEIKRQFYPKNVTYKARKKLRELKHKSSISDYAIKEWEAPTKVFELRSFLGLANYYRRFIKGYSDKTTPLTDLLKKEKTWEWSKRCQTAFEGLKEAVMEESVLAHPDHSKVFEMQTDASDFAIGGVLMQEGHPIAFESHKLNDTERRYTVQDKEMTAPLTPLALASDYKGRSPLAAQVARSWNEQADVARSYLNKAAHKMKKWADKRRRPKEYKLGDKVMVKLLPQQFKSLRKVQKGLIRRYVFIIPGRNASLLLKRVDVQHNSFQIIKSCNSSRLNRLYDTAT
ncbi:hypothetical protein RJ639_042406 [Escallonia herrerae]|uniref:Reverse transcriptase/retrotransposon-derived protein RNase H-like domain-containing protein n=1 Tax=Escallonia herrerae TaxID=1293975 RepID=A0AA88WHC6_9ASTE|nr:hypothetical protein RJ639_042406 [Escallonia herrerae]